MRDKQTIYTVITKTKKQPFLVHIDILKNQIPPLTIMDTTSNSTSSTNDECTLTNEEIDELYNLSLHIISVFVILVVSLLGASISVVSTRVKSLHINPIIINTGKFLGSG
jgi:hypothetical protein